MKKFIFLSFLLLSTSVYGQLSIADLDSLLIREIVKARNESGLPELSINSILTACSRHHTSYMVQSRIVSHYQEMKLKRMRRLYSPKDRVAFFSKDMGLKEAYSEICLAIPVNKNASEQEIAACILHEIVNSDNRIALLHPSSRHFGVSALQRKSVVYATISIGLGYHNIVALIE